jgi:phosphoglycerate dehydrogenase-like enzyme
VRSAAVRLVNGYAANGAALRGAVLVTWMSFDPEDVHTGRLLRDAGLGIRLAPKIGPRSPAELARLLPGVVGAIVSTDPFDRSVLEAVPDLRVIARVGVGIDSIDLEAATEAGVVVTTTPGANHETVADHALALILASVRRIVEHDASIRRGEWTRAGAMTPWDFHRTTVGLVGFGEIGRAVARRLRGFGVKILVSDPVLPLSRGVLPLNDLLARSDIVSLHLPLLETTRGIIGARELARMRPDATLVNTSRGPLIDQPALIEALRTGRLRGAALDVFADEPAVPQELIDLPNVVLTPHIGGLSVRSIEVMTQLATRNVLGVLRGRPNHDAIVNPAALDHPRLLRDVKEAHVGA